MTSISRFSPSAVARAVAFSLALPLVSPALQAAEDMPLPATRARAPVTLNFANAEIEMVSRAMGTMLDRQILVDPRVRGQINLTSDKAVPPAEAWRQYLAALRGLGFTVVENAGLLKVVPEAEAKLQAGTVQIGQPQARGDQILTQIFRLNHENPNNLVPVLRPLISANNTINANAGNSTLIITDYADNLQRMAKIIAALDQPAVSDVEVVPLKHAVAADIAPLVQRLSEGGSGMVVPGAAPSAAGGTQILIESRSNSLIVRAANAAKMGQIKALIEKLDRPTEGGGPAGKIWVVYLKNADAVKLAEVLRAAMSSGTGAAGGASSSGLGNTANRPANPGLPTGLPQGANTSQSTGLSAAATSPVTPSAGPSTGGQIQADPSTNSLIISASEPVYRQLRQVIEQLDTRRAQVYVESLIVKVDANKAAEFGVQWQNLFGDKGDSTIAGLGTNFGNSGNNILDLSAAAASGRTGVGTLLSSANRPAQGLNIGVLKKISTFYSLGALARFLETNTGANILSTPNLVSLDNEEAKIVIGQNVPFTTGSFTNTGTGNGAVNPFQTIERKDVGITLRIKSQIGEGGTVRMTIFQENSSLQPNSQITDKSSIETNVVIDNGQIMVLGGLLKDEYGDSEGKVPGLGSLPIIGNLFRNETRNRVKSNLLLFLRPVVLRSQADADRLTVDRYDAIRAIQEARQPEPSVLVPVNEAPVLPALQPGQNTAPLVNVVPPAQAGAN
ncbi:type II secretion system secretin GspD [Ideonella sp.]|jgi:general secretion pathway protein D|uniref:type II secretion system secretin GspD n=1 Tax=Ideonella sp. TaxID=1929293 RepID=UPI0037BE905B